MKILFDSCVWGGTKIALEKLRHDVVWSGDWHADPGDEEILARARADARVRVTLDKDFGELATIGGHLHSGIVRLVGFSAKDQAAACDAVARMHGDELSRGAIVTVEPGRIRIRSAQS